MCDEFNLLEISKSVQAYRKVQISHHSNEELVENLKFWRVS